MFAAQAFDPQIQSCTWPADRASALLSVAPLKGEIGVSGLPVVRTQRNV